MARNKEMCVIVLDVGPTMHPYIAAAGKAVSSFVEAKMLTKPGHEVALLLTGTTGTSNDLNSEMAAKGDAGQYAHITCVHPLAPPDISYLTTLHHLPKGRGGSDFVNGLTVAVDLMYKTMETNRMMQAVNVVKRVLLLSNFLCQAAQDPDDIFIPVLIERMQERGIMLDVVSLDVASDDVLHKGEKAVNNDMLSRIMSELRATLVAVRHPMDLLGVFKARDYSHTAYYSGRLSIGDVMTINVKVCKKTAKEKWPSLNKYSDKAQGGTHGVSMDTEFHGTKDPDEVVPPEDRVKAYKYGQQVVPMAADMEALLKYSPDKGLQLVGFVDAELVPRHHYMKDVWLIAPEKENAKAIAAMSALVQGLKKTNKGAVLRFVPRGGGSVFLGWATPLPATAKSPDCLILNYLPFLEDVRSYEFAAFDAKPEMMPSGNQVRAVEELVKKMDLATGPSESLAPESTVNPLLHRFYEFMAAKAIDQDAQVPEKDLLVERTLMPRMNEMEGSAEAMEDVVQQFKVIKAATGKVSGAEGEANGSKAADGRPHLLSEGRAAFSLVGPVSSRVDAVGTSTPVEDFNDMLAQDMVDAAFSGLQRAITTLVDTSLGDRSYGKASKALKALREAAVKHARWQSFNSFLHDLSGSYENHVLRSHWWRAVMDDKVTLISSEESDQSDVSAAAANDFLLLHTHTQAEAAAAPAADMEEEEDEFAGMD